MVRVGGGWDTLQNYLDKHDPCRCRRGKTPSFDLGMSQLRFERHTSVNKLFLHIVVQHNQS